MSDAEFDTIFDRIKKAGLSYGSAPWSLDNGELNEIAFALGGFVAVLTMIALAGTIGAVFSRRISEMA